MLRRLAWKMLGIDALERRVDKMDSRLEATELQCNTMLRHFGGYKHRTKQELKLMGGQVQDLIVTCEALVERSESEQAIKQAKALLRRLRNNRGRIHKAQKGLCTKSPVFRRLFVQDGFLHKKSFFKSLFYLKLKIGFLCRIPTFCAKATFCAKPPARLCTKLVKSMCVTGRLHQAV